jgi:hypothetical protein
LLNGKCEDCPDYNLATTDGLECEEKACEDTRTYLAENGYCDDCDEYTY